MSKSSDLTHTHTALSRMYLHFDNGPWQVGGKKSPHCIYWHTHTHKSRLEPSRQAIFIYREKWWSLWLVRASYSFFVERGSSWRNTFTMHTCTCSEMAKQYILRRIYDQEIVWSLLSKYRWPKTSNSLQCLYTCHCQRQTWTCFKLLFLFCSTTFGYCIDLFEKKSLFQRIAWLVVCTLTRLRIACLPLSFFFLSCFWSSPQPALRSLFFLLFFLLCRPISVKTARGISSIYCWRLLCSSFVFSCRRTFVRFFLLVSFV